MTEDGENTLLPTGLRDILPDDAALEAETVEKIITFFGRNGYERVKTPLIEFEDGLLSGAGSALTTQTFRLMDPVSQRMMGVRADITPQIARIARTLLSKAPRPLRLSYAGDVLRVRGSQLRPGRQIVQVGAELIGSGSSLADAEIILLAADAITAVGADNFSVDLTVPRLVPSILEQLDFSDDTLLDLRAALDRKDPEAIKRVAGSSADILADLMIFTGPVETVLPGLNELNLPDIAREERSRLEKVVIRLRAESPDLRLTIDPIENRGFEYHTGIGFTIFSGETASELARGGRYRVRASNSEDNGEKATGVTLYVDSILDMIENSTKKSRVLVGFYTSRKLKSELQSKGWTTVSALDDSIDLSDEAKRLACSHYLGESGPEPIKG
ncbi:MAG: ATP phosphoribosyltransferase regulatory subunit [Rhodospirillaceae bacterium]|nr:ATP phosphoribosyltransferase regulatory subunit [Rhodospirillaceae bacterium]|tara:strand:- start:532 stop:1692 length:1161 start_codon:yes stop_codon:yes gene_type:complete